jgi:hypothetical protein
MNSIDRLYVLLESQRKKSFSDLCCLHFRPELFLDFVCAQYFSPRIFFSRPIFPFGSVVCLVFSSFPAPSCAACFSFSPAQSLSRKGFGHRPWIFCCRRPCFPGPCPGFVLGRSDPSLAQRDSRGTVSRPGCCFFGVRRSSFLVARQDRLGLVFFCADQPLELPSGVRFSFLRGSRVRTRPSAQLRFLHWEFVFLSFPLAPAGSALEISVQSGLVSSPGARTDPRLRFRRQVHPASFSIGDFSLRASRSLVCAPGVGFAHRWRFLLSFRGTGAKLRFPFSFRSRRRWFMGSEASAGQELAFPFLCFDCHQQWRMRGVSKL